MRELHLQPVPCPACSLFCHLAMTRREQVPPLYPFTSFISNRNAPLFSSEESGRYTSGAANTNLEDPYNYNDCKCQNLFHNKSFVCFETRRSNS